jgi:hypothetical protein
VTVKHYALLAAGLVMAWPDAAPAQTNDIRTELMHCLTFTGAVERLSCYDRLAHGAASGALGAPVGPVSGPPPSRIVAAPSPPATQELGREELRGSTPTPGADKLTAEIVNFQKGPDGRFTISLNNGEIWTQVAGDTTSAQYHAGRTHSVTISRGTLGSYDLRFNDRNASFKVQRLH